MKDVDNVLYVSYVYTSSESGTVKISSTKKSIQFIQKINQYLITYIIITTTTTNHFPNSFRSLLADELAVTCAHPCTVFAGLSHATGEHDSRAVRQ